MSNRLQTLSTLCILLALPATSLGQRSNCCPTRSSSITASQSPRTPCNGNSFTPTNGNSFRMPQLPNMSINQGFFNTPTGMRRPVQPLNPIGQQQNPQLHAGILQNQLLQQGMMQEVHNQYLLQDQVKRQLLQFALEAPAENLQRELKNPNAFVRWAASVELNRRWKVEMALEKKEKETARAQRKQETARQEAVVVAAAAPARTSSSISRATVTPVSQTLLLQIGIPK